MRLCTHGPSGLESLSKTIEDLEYVLLAGLNAPKSPQLLSMFC